MPAIPLIILSPGRSYSTVVSAMLGRHDQVYAFPELCLLARDTMAEFLDERGAATFEAGLVRSVCDLLFGSHAASNVEQARRWIEERRHLSTRAMFDILAARTNTAVVIEKTPIYTSCEANLERLERIFDGEAHFLHLTRHPIPFSRSLVETYLDFARVVGPQFAQAVARHPESLFFGLLGDDGSFFPDDVWYVRNRRIVAFLDTVERRRSRRLRGEDMVNRTADAARTIADWLGLPLREQHIAAMREPEKWRHAAGTVPHGDRHFRTQPELREAVVTERLTDRPQWPSRYTELPTQVRELAGSLGYL